MRACRVRLAATLILVMMPAGYGYAAPDPGPDVPARGDTVRVAPPSAREGMDRANVQAALDSARSGDTVLFEPGTYVLGAGVVLDVPDVTVIGHPRGTVLRGCEPAAFDIEESQIVPLVFGCTGFFVRAERQTIRDLTFEYMWHGIVAGPYPASMEELAATQGIVAPYPAGGQHIEGNTFRSTPNGIRFLGVGDEVSVVRDNDFIDTGHAIGIYGPPVHFVGNRVRVDDPSAVPTSGHPLSAILVSPQYTDCSGHVVAENTVRGHPGAIYVVAARGTTCRDVEIRDNVIQVERVPVPVAWMTQPAVDGDSTMVGVPITLASQDYVLPGIDPEAPDGVVEGVLVQGNRVEGADGIGILLNGVRNRIVDNRISDIRRRAPYPGINWDPALVTWELGNGSGIWVAPDARENRISGNEIERTEGASITLEGSGNVVRLLTDADSVVDLGIENQVSTLPDGH